MNAATIVTKTRNGYTVTTVRHFSDAYDTSRWLAKMGQHGAPADAVAEDAVRKEALTAQGLAVSYFSDK